MSKLQRLRDNIAAIECALKGENNAEVLNKYSGFGGLGFVTLPLDKKQWSKTDAVCYEDTVRLHEVLKEHSNDEKEYRKWVNSLKASTLTAFYTPEVVISEIMCAIYEQKGITPMEILDPAAGSHGRFARLAMELACAIGKDATYTAYEKDVLSGMMLRAVSQTAAMNERAAVRVEGFENFPESELGTYDLVATNVPFGNIEVFDDAYSNSGLEVRRDAAKMIHRYFMLKGLDCLREGGIEAMIITSNYLNNDSGQVEYLLKQARLIGAYRLANNLFKENGTEVGTDLIVLQKDSKRGPLTEDEKLLITECTEEGCPNNLYFVEHYDRIMATGKRYDTDAYGKPGIVYVHDQGVQGIAQMLGTTLAEDMKNRCDVKLFESEAARVKSEEFATAVGETTETGTTESGAIAPTVKKKGGKRMTKQEQALRELHEVYTSLYTFEQEQQAEDGENRTKLNALYDAYCDKYGRLNINSKEMARRLKVADVLALEIQDAQGKWGKADIMLRPVAFSLGEPASTLKAHEALAASLNEWGKPMMQWMCEKSGMESDELIEELKGEVFYNPLNGEWEIKARFISGNVIEKIARIEAMMPAADATGTVAASLAALRAAVPAPIPFEELDFNLGERWVKASVYEDFASDFFSMPGGKVTIRIRYQKSIDQYSVACTSSMNEKIRTEFSVSSECSNTLNGIDLLQYAMQNSTPKMMKFKRDKRGVIITKENSKGELEELKEEDGDAIQLANDKIEQIRQGYIEWLMRQPRALQQELADEYNRLYNCMVKPKYDGSHQTFPGLDREALKEKYGVEDLYQSQKDCIWMLLQNAGGICDHEVGTGKTLIMCIAAHEMKRLGICHKPMIIGMKANVSAIAEQYQTAYPEARILFAKEADYSTANRVDFFNRMKNNDWDCIIMSHDQFGKLPQSAAIEEELLDDELQQLEDALYAVEQASEGWEITKKQTKGLEIRKKNLEAKIEKLQDKLGKQKDEVVDFDMMGIDMLFVDESHVFKNLGFTTKHDRVAGIGNTDGSQRAFNLLMAIRTIQKKRNSDLGAVFLSGTTVTNSLTELYSLFRYLRPRALEKQGITCFDAWAAIFTRKSQEWEFGITNNVQLKERFRYFIKVPELALFYNEITDFRTAEDVGLDRPQKVMKLLSLEPTPDQEAYIQTLMAFAQTGDFSLIGKVVNEKQEKAKMLYATDLARKMSLDMRLIDPIYGDHPNNKASCCAKAVKKYYDAFDCCKGVQLVFCDLSAWKGKETWSIYGEIKRKLVEMGVPSSEVRFIQEASSDRVKQQMIQLANEGKIRVLFGSTQTLGTGVNVQDRIVAIHELDTPWRPSDMEQREGRGVRKGNWVARQYADNKVDVYIYAVKRSLDAYKFHLLHCKQVFISQLKRGQLSVRTLDEGDMDEKSGMNFAEYMAVLSGNTDLLERAKLEKKIAALESSRKNFQRQHGKQMQELDRLQVLIPQTEQNLKDAQADAAAFEQAKQLDEFGQVKNALQLRFCSVPDGLPAGSPDWCKLMGDELLRLNRETDTAGNPVTIGSIYGFQVIIRTDIVGSETVNGIETPVKRNKFFVKRDRIMYHADVPYLDQRGANVAVLYPLNVVSTRPALEVTRFSQQLEQYRKSLAELEVISQQTWGRDDELHALKDELALLDKRIRKQLDSEDSKQAAQQQQEEPLPVRFVKSGRYHNAYFERKAFSLVSEEEMRDFIRDYRGYGYLTCTEWKNSERVPAAEWNVEFGSSKGCADFIEYIDRLQKEREVQKQAA